jgi:hypothetical protein
MHEVDHTKEHYVIIDVKLIAMLLNESRDNEQDIE